MCGITGWIDWDNDLTQKTAILKKMSDTLTFRGPDAEGFWLSPHAALAHRRLIVVDPQGGGQPMIRTVGDRTYTIIYNGELYNTPDLRSELELLGHTFRSHSDTEVLLESYIAWGPNCVHRLNGIYAFAIWSEHDQNLFLARDRMGVKPLFYYQQGHSFLFASELKALLAHPEIKPEINAEGLAEIFVMGPSRTPGHGVYQGIKELRPGYSLIHNQGGTSLQKYWSLESRPHQDNLSTTIETVRQLFIDSVQRQLVADVPVCTFLSGGLDSSAITAIAANHFKDHNLGTLHTYSVDYEGNDQYFQASHFQPNSDSQWVHKVTSAFNTQHHNVIVSTSQLVEALIPALRARDLPGMADVDSSLLLFCQEVKKDATVALSGECADEIFGGYPWFHDPDALNNHSFPWIRNFSDKINLLSPEIIEKIKPNEYLNQRYLDTIQEVPVLPGEAPIEARRREMFYLNLNWFMTTLLDRKDRMSMATGLEVRVPFCDHRIVEYMWNVPWSMKMYENREKGILRKALEGILPEDVLYRKKSPYPKTHNPAYLNAVRQWLNSILDDPSSPIKDLINIKALRAMTNLEGDAFDRPWFGQLMTGPQLFAYLASVDTWLRENKVAIR